MDSHPVPLRSLLADIGADLGRAREISTSGQARRNAVDEAWPFIKDSVDQAVGHALHQDLVGALVEGWSLAKELTAYADPIRYPPNKTVTMTLGHTTSSIEVDPELTLVVGEVVRQKLPLTVIFRVALESVVLTIHGGEIHAVGLGRMAVGAKLKWSGYETPLALRSPELELPGTRRLDPSVRIPRLAHSAD